LAASLIAEMTPREANMSPCSVSLIAHVTIGDVVAFPLGYHHFALRARGVTTCDTSHDVAPTPDFSGSDDETKAQAPARGPYLMIRWTDGADGGAGGTGRRRTGLEDAISGPILRFSKRFLPETPPMKSRTGQTFSEMGADLSNALKWGQDDIEGIRLRRRGVYGPNPRFPAVWADVFGSFVRRCIGEISLSQVGWLISLDLKATPKEYGDAGARGTALFLGFRILLQMPSVPLYAVALGRSRSRKSNGLGSNRTRRRGR
ncbi:hypothetical protein THAOC_30732, partial [Thalassiosira oceanica]